MENSEGGNDNAQTFDLARGYRGFLPALAARRTTIGQRPRGDPRAHRPHLPGVHPQRQRRVARDPRGELARLPGRFAQDVPGVDEYMDWSGILRAREPVRHDGLQDARVRHDLQGDAAFVAFVADVEAKTPAVPSSAPCGSRTSTRSRTARGYRRIRYRPSSESLAAQQQTPRTFPRRNESVCSKRAKRYGGPTSRGTAPRSRNCCPRS